MLRVNRKALSMALEKIAGSIDPKPAIPVLKGVLFSIVGEHLKLMASNKTNFSVTEIPIVFKDAQSSFCIDGKWILEYTKMVTGDEIEIGIFEKKVGLKCGASSVEYPTIEISDFPEFPEVKGKSVKMQAEDLKKAIKHTSIASTDTDSSRPILRCIHIEIAKDPAMQVFKMLMVALDGQRLALYGTKVEYAGENLSANVPANALLSLAKDLNGDTVCMLEFSNSFLCVQYEGTKHAIALDIGEFIDYRKLMGVNPKTVIKVKRDSFLAAIDMLTLIKTDKPILAITNIVGDKIIVKGYGGTSDKEAGCFADIETELPILEKRGEDIKIGAQALSFEKPLKVMFGDEFTITLSSPTHPIYISPCGLYEFIYMILPVTLKS